MNESGTRCTRMRLGTMELRSTGVSELSLIASVNEAIKCAIAASERISLIAFLTDENAYHSDSHPPLGDSLVLCKILINLMNLRASALRIACLPRFVLCADEKRL